MKISIIVNNELEFRLLVVLLEFLNLPSCEKVTAEKALHSDLTFLIGPEFAIIYMYYVLVDQRTEL